jgi:predicted Fe-Mo cluster-binding NifX family protein
MKLCFPVEKDEGLDSRVFGHFGSAPAFLIIDTVSREKKTVTNNDQHHAHGMCSPLSALSGEQVDAIIVCGIGAGALSKLARSGIQVFKAVEGTVSGNMALFELSHLNRFDPGHICKGQEGCAH